MNIHRYRLYTAVSPLRAVFFLCALIYILSCIPTRTSFAQTTASSTPDIIFGVDTTEIQSKIDARRADIDALEREIAKNQAEIIRVSGEKRTLQGDIRLLDLNKKKLGNDIAVTQNNIVITDALLRQLSAGIDEKERRRLRSLSSLADTLRELDVNDGYTFQEAFLSAHSMSNIWEDVDALETVQVALRGHLTQVRTIKADLEGKKAETEKKRAELAGYRARLADQKSIVEYNTKEKNRILTLTNNKESSYKKLLAENLAKKDAFEQELLSFESQLKLITDPSSLPQPGKLLRSPVDGFYVTQEFGDTAFARSRPGLYSGAGHNGIDLRAAVGSQIKSAADGVVGGTGDTDTVCPGASYGKWVLVNHYNGLSTLYAHLSLIRVKSGDTVSVGDLVGYAGLTGYTTGPHLHFTVYATAGLRIIDRKSKACGGTYRMPVADLRAYLNPMLYL